METLSASSSESDSDTETSSMSETASGRKDSNVSIDSQKSHGSEYDECISTGDEQVDYDAMFPDRYDPKKDKYMIECMANANETMKPPIVKPWNPPRQRKRHFDGGGHRGGRGGGRGGGHRGGFKRGRFQR